MSTTLTRPSLNWDLFIKVAVFLASAAFAYSSFVSKTEQMGKDISEIKLNQKEERKENELRRDVMETQVKTLQIQIGVINEKLENLKED